MKKTKRLVMLAIALVLTFAMATTTTFAWFTVNDTVSVKGISGTATSDTEGLLISKTGEEGTFRAYFRFDEEIDLKLVPVTPSTDEIPWVEFLPKPATVPVIGVDSLNEIHFYNTYGVSYSKDGEELEEGDKAELGFTKPSTTVPEEGAAYFQQTFYFRSDVEMEVAISNIKIKTTPAVDKELDPRYVSAPTDIEANTYGKHPEYERGDIIETELVKAIRIALFDQDGKLIAVYHFVEGTVDGEGVITYKQDFDSETSGYNMAGYLFNEHFDDEPITGGIANATKLLVEDATDEVDYNMPEDFSGRDDKILLKPDEDYDPESGLINWYSGSLTVVIWIEGTDGDCINSVINNTLDIGFTFKGNTEIE